MAYGALDGFLAPAESWTGPKLGFLDLVVLVVTGLLAALRSVHGWHVGLVGWLGRVGRLMKRFFKRKMMRKYC